VQVFRSPDCDTIRTLRRPATEKRQGTKSPELGHRLRSERYGDLILTPAVMVGTMLAHLMFDLAPIIIGTIARGGPSQWLAEAVATFTLVLTILGGLRFPRSQFRGWSGW
jgi:hypothetical protein